MTFIKCIGLILAIIAIPLLILKLAEMVKNIIWVYKARESFIKRINISIKSGSVETFNRLLNKYKFPFFPGNIKPTRWMRSAYCHPVGRRLIGMVFRFPNLIVLCSISIVMISQREASSIIYWGVRLLLSFIIFAGIWTKVLHLLLYRYRFGVVDNFLLSLSVPTMTAGVGSSISRRAALQNFIRIILSSLATFLIGYGAIYYSIAKGLFPGNSLNNIDFNSPVWVQSLYFSTATLLTVGFGDIAAKGPLAQLIVTSEMMLGLLLLVIFITAFSTTIPATDD